MPQQNCAAQQFSGGSYGNCGTDPKCICSNDAFLSTIACCLAGACSAADQASAITFAIQICQAQGVAVPTVVSCATAATATPTSGSPTTGGAATTAPEVTPTGANDAAGATPMATAESTAGAYAPMKTAAVGMEMLGLAAAGAGLVFL